MNARSLPLLFASLLLAACGGTIVDGGGSYDDAAQDTTTAATGGGGSTGQGGSTGSSTSEPSVPAVALTRAQNDILWEEYWESHDPSGSTSTGGGQNLDPNDLFLHLSDVGVSCGSPTVDLPCGGHHEMTLVLPPALQQVGVYDLEDPLLVTYSMMSETGTLNSPDPKDCPWGGGSPGSGTLTILSIDQTEVHFRVKLTSGLWESDPSGDYTAPRCPTTN